MPVLIDQTGYNHTITTTPQRIISLVPSLTELLCDLGLEASMVGITKFCVHPPQLRAVKKVVGGTKKVHLEKIRLLKPDIIICNKEENTEEIVASLRTFCTVWVTDIAGIDDCMKTIADFGTIFNKRTEARKWNDRIGYERETFNSFVKQFPARKAAYFIWKDPYMVAGRDTFIDEMLRLNRFENIVKDPRYPEVGLASLGAADPELILLSSEPFPFSEQDAFEIGRYTHHAKTIFVDGEMFSWYGSRVVKAFDYFRILHGRLT